MPFIDNPLYCYCVESIRKSFQASKMKRKLKTHLRKNKEAFYIKPKLDLYVLKFMV